MNDSQASEDIHDTTQEMGNNVRFALVDSILG